MSERFRHVLAIALMAVALPLAAVAPVPDPTRPAVLPRVAVDEAGASVAALVLQSTLVSPRQRSAIISGRRYRLGDAVGDVRLTAIGPGWVRLQGLAGSTELRLSFSNPNPPVNR